MLTAEIIKGQLGGIQASINFKTLEPFAHFAERWFKDLAGEPLMDYLKGITAPAAGSDDADLLYLAHACMSWKCYELAFPHMKFKAGELGLQKVNGQNAVAISKWEYVDSKEANLAMLDLALENFWSAMESIKPAAWTGSTAYTKRQQVFIRSATELAEHIPTLGRKNRLFEQLLTYIRRAEQSYIRPILTEADYIALKVKWRDPAATWSPQEQILLDLIRPAVAHMALYEAYPYLPLTLDVTGITESRSKDGALEQVAPGADAKNGQKRQLYTDGQNCLAELNQYLQATATASLFPGYYQAQLAKVGTQLTDDFTNESLIIL
ncbi:hypothetical protein GO730_05690 [Spirosoma sp. HMF3257]|uniref:Uncharacterized protein n=1 Tax=Spirosoma telluris TaxID=2183553 RepID=A0A327NMY9_9BACT|nr:hypothetical protein [Spirosoma telluris]RAI73968.1 hypothetical protein HMF3257_05650 [Spirosoma telluris]